MVIASVNTDTQRFELESVEGGWVELKEFGYGQSQRRFSELTNMKGSFGDNAKSEDRSLEIGMLQDKAAEFDFRHCIVDHNLEYLDSQGQVRKFNFKGKHSLENLKASIGEEISGLIENINIIDTEGADGKGN